MSSKGLLYYDLGEGVTAFSTMRDAALPFDVLQPHQTHTANVACVTSRATTREDLEGADALVTDIPDFAIGVRTADCIPVLLYDPAKKVVAAVHAGWRGTVARIAGETVRKMSEVYGCSPADIRAQIGPGIGPQSFQVGDELLEKFAEAAFDMDRISFYDGPKDPFSMKGGWHIDLWKANEDVLAESGVRVENIKVSGICTYERNDLFYSARREGVKCPRIINAIKLL